MLAKVAAAAGGITLAAGASQNRPPLSDRSPAAFIVCMVLLIALAYIAGRRHPQDVEASDVKASARAKARAAAHARQGQAVQVNIGSEQLVDQVAAAVLARLDVRESRPVGVGAPTVPALPGEPNELRQPLPDLSDHVMDSSGSPAVVVPHALDSLSVAASPSRHAQEQRHSVETLDSDEQFVY